MRAFLLSTTQNNKILKFWHLENTWEQLEIGLQKDIRNGHISPDEFNRIKEFDVLKADPKWRSLMEKYLPELIKD